MKIVVFGHPAYMGSPSMNGFVAMVSEGMRARGHDVELWRPEGFVRRLGMGPRSRKYLGYVDQFILFPWQARARLRRMAAPPLVVLGDHALGMWMSFLAEYPHVIHSHDFNPLRELAGDFPSRQLSWSGKLYQSLIRNGFGRGRMFIAVSQATARDLVRFYPGDAPPCEVVYNGLSYPFGPMDTATAVATLKKEVEEPVVPGMLLHIGGNQWYKNRAGVLALYAAYCRATPAASIRPLWMMGPQAPDAEMLAAAAQAEAAGGNVRWLVGLSTQAIHAAYALAAVFVFPSLEEGFGWPIIEAMACGTPVLTTDRAPMSEIAGGVATLIERMPEGDAAAWAARHAAVLADMAAWTAPMRQAYAASALAHAAKFSADHALDEYERIYRNVAEVHGHAPADLPARAV
ncbi:glycosyltransferase [Cupriavidus sp. SW-Y-13]|uniref:glycosyltransferase n=1 Tax=Cupriavidus sp. SW-Y-13 TaxID=2653854 RepID=UPI0013660809|nr:glycosyltransferase [Cupriavidus sp. SW-Y-13]